MTGQAQGNKFKLRTTLWSIELGLCAIELYLSLQLLHMVWPALNFLRSSPPSSADMQEHTDSSLPLQVAVKVQQVRGRAG